MTTSRPSQAHDSSADEKFCVAVNLPDLRMALGVIMARAAAGRDFSLFTVNLDHLVKLERDAAFRAAYKSAELVTADGWPVVWLLRRQGFDVERATGADLVEPLCREAARAGLPIYFIGPGAVSQRKALDILAARYPDLRVAGAEAPSLSTETLDETTAQIGARLAASGASICFISLGAPKQEALAARLRALCPNVGFICVGAALDFISGHMIRAPGVIQRLRLEWFWRLASDPKRLGLRYAECFSCSSALHYSPWQGAPPTRACAAPMRPRRPVGRRSLVPSERLGRRRWRA